MSEGRETPIKREGIDARQEKDSEFYNAKMPTLNRPEGKDDEPIQETASRLLNDEYFFSELQHAAENPLSDFFWYGLRNYVKHPEDRKLALGIAEFTKLTKIPPSELKSAIVEGKKPEGSDLSPEVVSKLEDFTKTISDGGNVDELLTSWGATGTKPPYTP